MAEVAAVNWSGGVMIAGVGWPGYGHPEGGEGNMKLRKVYFASRTRQYDLCWQFIWTREDLNRSNRMEFNNSVKVLGVADDAGFYSFLDEFGNIFRSFFIAYDNQDLSANKDYSIKKQSATNEECEFKDPSSFSIGNYSIEEDYGFHIGEYEQTQEYGEEISSDSINSSNESSPCGPASLAIEAVPQHNNLFATDNNRDYNQTQNFSLGKIKIEKGNGEKIVRKYLTKKTFQDQESVNKENDSAQKQLSAGSDENAGKNYDLVPPPNSSAFPDRGDLSAAIVARGMPSDCSSSSSPPGHLVRCRRSTESRARKNKKKKASNRIPNDSATTTAGEEQMVLPEKNLLLKDKADRATDEEGGRWRLGFTTVKPSCLKEIGQTPRMTVISLSMDNRSLDNVDDKHSGDSIVNRWQAAESPSKPVFAPHPPDHEQCAAMATKKTTLSQEQPAPAATSLIAELKTCSRAVDAAAQVRIEPSSDKMPINAICPSEAVHLPSDEGVGSDPLDHHVLSCTRGDKDAKDNLGRTAAALSDAFDDGGGGAQPGKPDPGRLGKSSHSDGGEKKHVPEKERGNEVESNRSRNSSGTDSAFFLRFFHPKAMGSIRKVMLFVFAYFCVVGSWPPIVNSALTRAGTMEDKSAVLPHPLKSLSSASFPIRPSLKS
eukprot:gene34393-44430_t